MADEKADEKRNGTEEDEDVEVIRIDDKCTLEFDRKGNLKIGDCQGRVINPAELYFLTRVNDDEANR